MKRLIFTFRMFIVLIAVATVLTAMSQTAFGAPPVVKTVPFVPTNTLIPHDTWSGKIITLKGTSDSEGANFTWSWDFGDGSSVATGTVTNKYVIGASHVYTGTTGKVFTARLTVQNTTTGETGSQVYYVQIRDKSLSVEVNAAVDEGLWYLHKDMYRSSSGGIDYGSWTSGQAGGYASSGYYSISAANLNAFEVNGHLETGNSDNPYVETVQRAMRSIFTMLTSGSMAAWTGNALEYNPYTGLFDKSHDGNGNGRQVTINQGQPWYQGGMFMDAIVASGTPNATATTGPAGIIGQTYKDIVQDMLDAYAGAQYDYFPQGGGWRYGYNQAPDNSICQWAAIGIIAAERQWGCVVPSWLKPWNIVWLNYSHTPSGWYGYADTGPVWGPFATTPSGMVQCAMDGIGRGNPLWNTAESYIRNSFDNAPINYANNVKGYYYGLFSFVKSMLFHDANGIAEPLQYLQSASKPRIDWYAAEVSKGDTSDGVARTLVNDQSGSGYWYGHNATGDQYVLETGFAIMMLNRTVIESGSPVAVIEAVPNPGVVGQKITLNGSSSYHQDHTKKIVSYAWDFDNDGQFDDATGPRAMVGPFPALGDYVIGLKVTDNANPAKSATSLITLKITIPPIAPTAQAGRRYIFCQQSKSWFLNGNGSVNPDEGKHEPGCPGNTITKYEWDLDGSGNFNNATGVQPNVTEFFTAKGPGNYLIQLRVTDNTAASFPSSGLGNLSSTDAAEVIVGDDICTKTIKLEVSVGSTKAFLDWKYAPVFEEYRFKIKKWTQTHNDINQNWGPWDNGAVIDSIEGEPIYSPQAIISDLKICSGIYPFKTYYRYSFAVVACDASGTEISKWSNSVVVLPTDKPATITVPKNPIVLVPGVGSKLDNDNFFLDVRAKFEEMGWQDAVPATVTYSGAYNAGAVPSGIDWYQNKEPADYSQPSVFTFVPYCPDKPSHEVGIEQKGIELGYFLRELGIEGRYNFQLVGHSLGGLTCRAYLQRTDESVKYPNNDPVKYKNDCVRLVTTGTPHNGAAADHASYTNQQGLRDIYLWGYYGDDWRKQCFDLKETIVIELVSKLRYLSADNFIIKSIGDLIGYTIQADDLSNDTLIRNKIVVPLLLWVTIDGVMGEYMGWDWEGATLKYDVVADSAFLKDLNTTLDGKYGDLPDIRYASIVSEVKSFAEPAGFTWHWLHPLDTFNDFLYSIAPLGMTNSYLGYGDADGDKNYANGDKDGSILDGGDGVVSLKSQNLNLLAQVTVLSNRYVRVIERSRNHIKEADDYIAILAGLDYPVLSITAKCPVDLKVTAPSGQYITKDDSAMFLATYSEIEDDNSLTPHKVVEIPFPENGEYKIEVIPDSDAGTNDTYSLIVTRGDTVTVLADNAKIGDIPEEPYHVAGDTAPIANAGPDQKAYAGVSLKANVTLNGSGSTDADGDPLTYKWKWTIGANSYEANGVSPVVQLPVGVHTIQLVVNDGTVDSAPDEVVVTVVVPAVRDLTVRSKETKVQLVWTHVGVPSYNVYRGLKAGGPYTMIANTTSTYSTYLDSNVTVGKTYYYVVREVLNGKELNQSNEVSATPTAPVRPRK